ncbi:Gfo/Idh/MocA family oxidoreductase [Collinsella sp. An2]|uniref:Gfo/Idh/MocA family protein n=1 Tax=Collinsella sp. An2 TaxID=1965585 RepID=UPI000B3915E5|nr:Gfo/Idh/MocA family oxidoreductase [Collinsella sp. An2]OUP09219.1 hypothetical protein B5F33_05665 [Collinsella sp. An2]
MNVGIAGAGTIVPAFLQAQQQISELKVKAICATPDMERRLHALADDYDIDRVYLDYEKMVVDETLDVIYVAVPNVLHYDFSRKALEQGKSVICEKPFCSCVEEAESLATLAQERGLFLFEATSNQYTPAYDMANTLVPRLGDIKIVALNYSQYSRRYDAFKRGDLPPVFDPAKSGGALMDLNVYNVHFVVGLFGVPESVSYTANIERGIDTSGVLVMTYPTFVCSLIGAKDCKTVDSISIEGDEGFIHSTARPNAFSEFSWSLYRGGEGSFAEDGSVPRLYHELRRFAEIMHMGDYAAGEQALRHSVAVQRILDEARRQVGVPVVHPEGR